MTTERFLNALLQRSGIGSVVDVDLDLELDNICRSVSFPRVSSKVYAVGGGENQSEANQKAVFLRDSQSEGSISL